MLEFLTNTPLDDHIRSLIEEKFYSGDTDGFFQEMIKILFRVGVVGIKSESYTTVYWSYLGQKLMTSEINEKAVLYVHPAFLRVLGIQPLE